VQDLLFAWMLAGPEEAEDVQQVPDLGAGCVRAGAPQGGHADVRSVDLQKGDNDLALVRGTTGVRPAPAGRGDRAAQVEAPLAQGAWWHTQESRRFFGRPALGLGVNQDIKSRVTYSVITKRVAPDTMRDFLLRELDRVGLGHNTFTRPAIDLIVRSADGVLRKARNLCVGCLIEAVRAANKTIDIDNVNRVLMQPHWQKETDLVDY
jgi:hypothetical protein